MALRQPQKAFQHPGRLQHVEELCTLLIPERHIPLRTLPDGYLIVRRDILEDEEHTYDVAVQFTGERPKILQRSYASASASANSLLRHMFYGVPLRSFLMRTHSLPEHLRGVFCEGYRRQLIRLPFREQPVLYDTFFNWEYNLTMASQPYCRVETGNDEASARLETVIALCREQLRMFDA